jgi:pimeloyl-ACP methyl ester carboxylesterase
VQLVLAAHAATPDRVQVTRQVLAEHGAHDLQHFGRWVWTGERGTPGAWRKDIEGFDVREQLGALRLPTLIVCGRHDQVIPPGSCTALHTLILTPSW